MENENIDKYQAYRQYEQAYNDKMNAFVAAYASVQNDPTGMANWAVIGERYMNEVNDALLKWEEHGFKKEMDAMLEVVDLELNLGPEKEQPQENQ